MKRATVVAGAALAVVTLVVGGLVLLHNDDPNSSATDVPSTDPSAAATTAPTADEAVPLDPEPLSIIASRPSGRDLDIVEITARGEERLIRTLSPDEFAYGESLGAGGAVSSTGWFSDYLGTGSTVVFVDLRDPASTPRSVPCRCISGRWNAAGDRYAVVVSGGGTFVIDPSTGTMVQVPGYYPVDGTPEPIWSADGTALLATSESTATGLGEWTMTPIDGGPSRPGSVALYWQRGTPYVDDRGRWIQNPHSGAMGGMVTVDSDESEPEVWYNGELQPAQLRDFSFTNKDNAIWLLLTTVVADRAGLEVVRSTAPGEHQVVVPFVPFDAVSGADFATIGAIAPDDSVLVAQVVHGGGWDEIVVKTDEGAAIELHGGTHVSGFVPTALANTFGVGGTETG